MLDLKDIQFGGNTSGSMKAFLRYLDGKSINSDCIFWEDGELEGEICHCVFTPQPKGAKPKQCVGYYKCNYIRATRNL